MSEAVVRDVADAVKEAPHHERVGALLIGRSKYLLIQLLALLSLGAVWQLLHLITPQNIVPGPADALPGMVELITSGQFTTPLSATLTRTVLGFIGGFALGMAYGIAAGRSAGFRHVTSLVFLVLLFFNALVLIFWGLALFGTTSNTAAAVICCIAVAPTVGVYVRDVALSMDDELLEMATAYHASRWQRLADVFLPFLMPAALACARIGFSLAWKITLLSEVFGLPNGIGWQIEQAYIGYQLAQLMAWLGIFILTLLFIEQSIRLVERRLLRWA